MGKTSSAVKNRYNAKAYDQLPVRVPKGNKETVQAHADAHGESLNGFINRAISETMERDDLLSTESYIGKAATADQLELAFARDPSKHIRTTVRFAYYEIAAQIETVLSMEEMKGASAAQRSRISNAYLQDHDLGERPLVQAECQYTLLGTNKKITVRYCFDSGVYMVLDTSLTVLETNDPNIPIYVQKIR